MPPKIIGSAGKEYPANELSAVEELQPQREETLEMLLERRERIELKLKKLQHQAKRADWDLSPAERIAKWGHRSYVGGLDLETWYGIGKHQYQYLVSQGLKPHHRFLDIACGSLRLGQFLIPYLDQGCYCGLEGEEMLVKAGLDHEILPALAAVKKPRFAYNYDFDFGFIQSFDFAIAQSLFTHLTSEDIAKCFRNLKPKAGPDSVFFFTYFEGDSASNPTESHANKGWKYSVAELSDIASSAGWTMTNIGAWGHPRKQKIAFAKLAN